MESHVATHGVEPICRVLQVAPSTWYDHARRKATPDIRSNRAKEDDRRSYEIGRIHAENFGVYGARKVWRQALREGVSMARCTVERLMKGIAKLSEFVAEDIGTA